MTKPRAPKRTPVPSGTSRSTTRPLRGQRRIEESDRIKNLLEIAAEAFATHGFEQASFNAIIEDAALSKGVVYHHFDDKADLFRAVMERALAPVVAAIEPWTPASDAEDFWSSMERLLESVVGVLSSDARTARLVRAAARSESAIAAAFASHEAAFEAWVHLALSDGRRVGAVREDLPIELLVACVIALGRGIDTWFAKSLQDTTAKRLKIHAQQGFGLFVRLLEPGSVSGPVPRSAPTTKPERERSGGRPRSKRGCHDP